MMGACQTALGSRKSVARDLTGGDKVARLAIARDQIARIERRDRGATLVEAVLKTGFPYIDAALPLGGFSFGNVHEIIGLAARRFATLLLARRLQETNIPALWLLPSAARHSLYGPGLVSRGVDPSHLIIARSRTHRDGLWSLEEALKSGAFALVLGELSEAIGATAARRLQLAAERGSSICLLLSEGQSILTAPEFATSRWRADPAQAVVQNAITRRISLTMERYRGRSSEVAEMRWSVPID
jgi:protein ImuA